MLADLLPDWVLDFIMLCEALWLVRWEVFSLLLYGAGAIWAIRLMVKHYPSKPGVPERKTRGKGGAAFAQAGKQVGRQAGRAVGKTSRLLWVLAWALAWQLPAKRKSKLFALGLLTIELGAVGVLLGLIAAPFFIVYSLVVGFIALWRKRYLRVTKAAKPLYQREKSMEEAPWNLGSDDASNSQANAK